MSREAFGPNLRRIRIQRGISIERIAAGTKINVELLKDLERNDFSRWPVGIYARAYVRQYAYAIGVDPDSTVDEFCRWFPQGDRRAERVVREQASIVGHELAWKDELPEKAGSNRRGTSGKVVDDAAGPGSSRPRHGFGGPTTREDEAARSKKDKSVSPDSLLMRLRRAFSKA